MLRPGPVLLAVVLAVVSSCGGGAGAPGEDPGGVGSWGTAGGTTGASGSSSTSTSSSGFGGAGEGGSAAAGAGGGALPSCDPLPGGATLSFAPAAPWEGGTTTISATAADPLTNVAVAIEGTSALPAPAWIGVTGSGPYTWSWSVSPLAAGDYCVTFSADPSSQVYQRASLHVADNPPSGTPVFKVVSNHQWTCEEEYTWAINVDTVVLDESGAPMPGVHVLVEHAPCETAADHPPPGEVVTGEDGTVRWENYNPKCKFHERVADGLSDTAIEIYTGIWETQLDDNGADCNYCNTFAENVYGHWSYTVTFQLLPASEICEVGTDHAGQSSCSPLLHWEEPAGPCSPL